MRADTDNSGGAVLTDEPGDVRVALSKPFDTYPGSKDAAGACERIIAAFPPHSVYVEAFLGNGAVMRRKLPALQNIGIDEDPEVIARWQRHEWPGLDLVNCCGIEWLSVHGQGLPPDALVYADPPYPLETRSKKKLYRRELTTEEHARLLDVLDALPCSVAISSYPNEQYIARLASWSFTNWPAMTRGGMRTEALWVRRSMAGFGPVQCVGDNYRERERIKRKVSRWSSKFAQLPRPERHAVLAAILEQERRA